jgi:hypothetical protein
VAADSEVLAVETAIIRAGIRGVLEQPSEVTIGVCGNLTAITGLTIERVQHYVRLAVRTWDHPANCSHPDYPVWVDRETHRSGVHEFMQVPDLWVGAYGAARRSLLLHMLDVLV